MNAATDKPRVLTGDTPTGSLHLGHYVGSLENRIAMQDEYDCYFLIANVHALTTRADRTADVRRDTLEIVKDWISVGMDPNKSTFVLQSEVPAIAELTWYFAMLLGYGRLMQNPTLKDEIVVKGKADSYSFGFLLYPVGQIADILAFRPACVPVGEDQVPHIEMCREIAARFNILYCTETAQQKGSMEKKLKRAMAEGVEGVFPIPEAKVGRIARLTGIDGKQKMSKSLGNAIFLADEPKAVQKKINKVFTGRGSMDDPPIVEGNTVLEYLRAFCRDESKVAELTERYSASDLRDGDLKKEVGTIVNELLEPVRTRRDGLADDDAIDVLKSGTARANAVAEQTLHLAKQAMKYNFFARDLAWR